jgi:uncharacterized protein YqjF (DUF2071 family)
MGTFLNNHPFAVEAFFESSLVLTYAFPKEELEPFIPPCVQLDTFNDRWAFIAVAMVQTSGLRPKGFPAILGNDFFLIGYRIFVRYVNNAGKRLRGLYILRSETDKKKMEWLGAIFTRYSYVTTDIHQATRGSTRSISSTRSGLHIVVDCGEDRVALPAGSPFTDWKEARRFAGPLPFTFSYDGLSKKVLIVEGVREDWQPRPVAVLNHEVAYLGTLGLAQPLLASAFIVEHIPYHWKKGRIEQWQG